MLRSAETKKICENPIIDIDVAPPPVKSQFDLSPPPVMPLSEIERTRLAQCDTRFDEGITKGWRYLVDAGEALRIVRDERLYREDYGSFEEYCRVKATYHPAYCYRLIAAAQILRVLSTIGDMLPLNEAQVRPLLGLPAEDLKAAWTNVLVKVGKGPLTTRAISEAVAPFKRKPREAKPPRRNKLALELIREINSCLDNGAELTRLLGKLEGEVRRGS